MRESLNQAIKMAQNIGYVFLTTADRLGAPHMSIVQPVSIDQEGRLKLMAWLCQYTLKNLEENPKVSLIVWDAARDTGYQLVGAMENMRQVALLDGYAPLLDEKKHFAQVEWKIIVRIEKVLNFQKTPYVDAEV